MLLIVYSDNNGGANKLLNKAAVNQIEAIDCELSIYRKGCVSIHVDLKKQYVTWRESKQWCNNFTKTITPKAVDEVVNFVRTSSLLNDILENHSFSDQYAHSSCDNKLIADNIITRTTGFESNSSGQKTEQLSEINQESDCLIPSEKQIDQDKNKYDDIDWYQHVDQSKSSWQIVMIFDDYNFTRNGRFPLPKGWIEFQRIIEKVSRAPFRLF